MSVVLTIDERVGGNADSQGNWISGTVGGLGASASTTVVFDLGPNWRMQRTIVVAGVGLVDSASSSVTAQFSADAAGAQRLHPAMTPNSASGRMVYSAGLSLFCAQLMVTDRYLRVAVTNGGTAQPAGAYLRAVSHDL